MNNSVLTQVVQGYDQAAAQYEQESNHRIAASESQLWQMALADVLVDAQGKLALDVGAGTGVFSRFLADAGFSVIATEPSAAMLAQARAHEAQHTAQAVRYEQLTAEATDALGIKGFSLIAARQSACYFTDPVAVFRQWHDALAPEGVVLVIDGFWDRHTWQDHDLVDELPLSCVMTRAMLAYCLRLAGFEVIQNQWLSEINHLHDVADGDFGARYKVVARKSQSKS